jgi:hypothetical protein
MSRQTYCPPIVYPSSEGVHGVHPFPPTFRSPQMDRAPYPAEHALSRIIDWPDPQPGPDYVESWRQKSFRSSADAHLTKAVEKANLAISCHYEGRQPVYTTLFHQTKSFTAIVEELVAVTAKRAPSEWAEAARLIVDFSINVLRSEKTEFHRFLNSQRKSIYWILDEALLRICLDQWEDSRRNACWDKATQPISLALATVRDRLPEWAELDRKAFSKAGHERDRVHSANVFVEGYFERTLTFLRESLKIYEIWRTVRLSGIGQLPNELADVIISDIFESEGLPVGDLRALYLPKGKGEA